MNQDHIRNFFVSLPSHRPRESRRWADRMLELTGTVQKRDMKSQLLDSMDLEREKVLRLNLHQCG